VHELSIASSLVGVVTEALGEVQAAQVAVVNLNVGVLSGVAPEALAFCWEVAARGTALEGARLEIRRVGVEVHCGNCGGTHGLGEPYRFCCPACGWGEVSLLRGKELEVESVELREAGSA
jgi:hydrogenase nickel incorporation protein HypA/HybF